MQNDQIKKGTPIIFENLYRQYYRMVAKQVSDFGLANTEPDDIFQEVLLVLVRKSRADDFQLTAQIGTLIYAIARNLLLQHSERKRETPMDDQAIALRLNTPVEDGEESASEKEKMYTAVAANLQSLETDCRQILQFFYFDKLPQADIATRMGYSESFVKVKKFRCLDYLRKKVKSDPNFINH